MTDMTLHELTGAALKLQDMILDGADPELIKDTMDSIGGASEKKLDAYADIRANYKAEAGEVGAEIKRLQDRKKMFTNAADYMSEAMLANVQALGGKVKTTRYTFGLRHTKQVVLDPKATFAPEYMKPAEVSKKAISDAIKAGKTVNGAKLVENVGLGVR